MTFGERLKELRKSKGKKVEEASQDLKITRAGLSLIMRTIYVDLV